MKWIILDRDGVVNYDSDQYIKSVEEWIPIPGSIEAIADLCTAGFNVAIATNQSGISRGLFSLDNLEDIHTKLNALVEEAGGQISGIFYCPHLPDDECDCRKPRAGLLDEIEKQFGIDLKGVPFVGDSEKDLQAGKQKGCLPILVCTGKGNKTRHIVSGNLEYKDVSIYDDLSAYAKSLIENNWDT